MYDIISMGSGVVDAFLDTGAKERNKAISFPAGTKILIKNLVFNVGGGGANTSVSFSRLGLKAGFLGKIGSGYNGDIILRGLKNNNVDFLGVRGKEHTGYSVILEGDRKHRVILTYKGASDNLRFEEIELKRLNTKWFYFTSMGEESFRSQKKLAEFAHKNRIKIAYNPSSYHTIHGADYLKVILKHTNVLSMNREEAGMLVKNGDLYKGLLRLGPLIVSITNGENEGGIYDGNFLYRYWPKKVKVKEATGAGDAFSSTFVAGLIKLDNIEEALKFAMTNAESVVQKRGAQLGLLSWNELERIVKHKRFKIKKEAL